MTIYEDFRMKKEFKSTIGQLIKDVRKQQKLNQKDFAEKYKFVPNAPQLSLWENGKVIPSRSTICEGLAELLKMPESELLEMAIYERSRIKVDDIRSPVGAKQEDQKQSRSSNIDDRANRVLLHRLNFQELGFRPGEINGRKVRLGNKAGPYIYISKSAVGDDLIFERFPEGMDNPWIPIVIQMPDIQKEFITKFIYHNVNTRDEYRFYIPRVLDVLGKEFVPIEYQLELIMQLRFVSKDYPPVYEMKVVSRDDGKWTSLDNILGKDSTKVVNKKELPEENSPVLNHQSLRVISDLSMEDSMEQIKEDAPERIMAFHERNESYLFGYDAKKLFDDECAITGKRNRIKNSTSSNLVAVKINPNGVSSLANAIVLTRDLAWGFEQGLWTIDPSTLRVKVSDRVKLDSPMLAGIDDERVNLPDPTKSMPYIQWHSEYSKRNH